MRIVAGEWRGRRLSAPKGTVTRPTSDRVREAVFSRVDASGGERLRDGVVLDAFAGTGALGLEALSRGFAAATFVETSRRALDALRDNIERCDAGPLCTVAVGDAFRMAREGAIPGSPFALLLLDPPYRIDPAAVTSLLADLAGYGAVGSGALAVWESDAATAVEWPDGYDPMPSRSYGSTAVHMATFCGGAHR